MGKKATVGKATGSKGRACLGTDGTYSMDNCEGLLINQGIGALEGQGSSSVTNTNTESTTITTNG